MKTKFIQKASQTQEVRLSSDLLTSLKILELNSIDLENLINREIAENPLIEIEYEKDNLIVKRDYIFEDRDFKYENLTEFQNLTQYLKSEMSYFNFTEKEYPVAEYIIENIDESGYFNLDIRNSAKNIGVDEKNFLKILAKIQQMEPKGIGARNLSECLLLQMSETDKKNSVLVGIIKNDLDNVAKRKWKTILKKYNLNSYELSEIVDKIKSFEPKPCRNFSIYQPKCVLPEFEIKIIDEKISLKPLSFTPRISLSKYYLNLFEKEQDIETRKYLIEKIGLAKKLIDNIEKRKVTVRSIIESIIEYQKEYFLGKRNFVLPMTLKTISLLTGYSMSTISRTVNEKYILTEKGVIDLKSYFSHFVFLNDKCKVSKSEIVYTIAEILREEGKSNYTDREICDCLKDKGINISRRTVNKYRNQMNIMPSYVRKNNLMKNKE